MDDNEKEVVNNLLKLAKLAILIIAIVSGAVGSEILFT
jgi:hypothetical protein